MCVVCFVFQIIIVHMTMKIMITPEYEDENGNFHSNRLRLDFFLLPVIYILTFEGYVPS